MSIKDLLNDLDRWQVETSCKAFELVSEIYEKATELQEILDNHEDSLSNDKFSLVDFFETHDELGIWNPKE